jgi:type II secretory ATPase GspE/PulE/Tfp pilus assembly ATPase PilB-like protein
MFIYDKIGTRTTSAITTRLKVLAKVKIDENKKPQD